MKSKSDQTGGNAQRDDFGIHDGSEAQRFLETLPKGMVKVLAEPKLAALSGKTAVIHEGVVNCRFQSGSRTVRWQSGTKMALRWK